MNRAFLKGLVGPFIPIIEEAIERKESLEAWYRNYSRNLWVQNIKENARRNKKKRRRCKRKHE
jgi:hypothetical protein